MHTPNAIYVRIAVFTYIWSKSTSQMKNIYTDLIEWLGQRFNIVLPLPPPPCRVSSARVKRMPPPMILRWPAVTVTPDFDGSSEREVSNETHQV